MKELNIFCKLLVVNRLAVHAYQSLWMKAIGKTVYNKWRS